MARHFAAGAAFDIFSLEQNGTCSRLQKPYDATASGGFAAAGLTNDTKGFTLIHIKGNIVHSVQIRNGTTQSIFCSYGVVNF